MDEILQRVGLRYEDLTSKERDTLADWSRALTQNPLTIEQVKGYVRSMRDAVEQALIDEPEFTYIFLFRVQNRRQILLKARLKNYLMFEAFLDTPERAKAALEKAIAGIASTR